MICWRCWGVGALLLLAGCAGLPREESPGPAVDAAWQARRQALASFTHWDLGGRVAVRAGDSGGTAHLRWRREGETARIDLFGAFGSGKVRIWINPNGARLRNHENAQFSGDSAQQVLLEGTGWHIPFDHLGHWVRGLPGPGEAVDIEIDAGGRLARLSQSGWDINFSQYDRFNQRELPRKIALQAWPGTVQVMSKQGENLGDILRVKLFIEYWNGPPVVGETAQ